DLDTERVLTVAWASPLPMRMDMLANTGSATEKQNLADAQRDSNRMLRKAERIIRTGKKDPNSAQMLKEAFGPNWEQHHDQLKKDVRQMRTANLKVHDSNAATTEAQAKKGQQFGAFVRGTAQGPVAHFGSQYHNKDQQQRAGTAVHELSHAVLGTGDHVAID
ncbi:1272_t:CDS:2, partial [Acaulospora colombiana]